MKLSVLGRGASLLAVLALVVSACAAQPTDETTIPTDQTTIPSEDPADQSPTHDLADGEYFAWLKGLTGDGVIVDPAEMLTGEEARQAAIEAGIISEGEDLPNDFFIRNLDDATEVVPVSATASYRLLLFAEGSPTETEVGYDEFAAVMGGETTDVYGVVDGEMPATIVVENGQIVSVVHVYLP